MTGPLISIIIPVYNASRFLSHAISSVLGQTYKNLEIILIDDCSTDDSLKICRSFDDPRIRVISNSESLGAAGARNKGLDVFTGEFVAFVDSDDYVHPEYIERLYKGLTDNGADICCCGFIRTLHNEDNFRYPSFAKAFCQDTSEAQNVKVKSGVDAALNIVDMKSMYYVVFWNKLYKRLIWDDLRLPEGKRAEDFFTSYSFLSRADKVAFIGAPLYYYYQQPRSVMHLYDDFSVVMEEALDDFEEFLNDKVNETGKRLKYSDLALIFRTDTVVEDYWKAYKKKNHSRMEETYKRALELKSEMEKRSIPLRFKFRLFYLSRFLYRIGRRLIDIKEALDMRLGRDKAGVIDG